MFGDRHANPRQFQLRVLTFSIPLLVLSGTVLYRRYFGTEEEKARWREFQERKAAARVRGPHEGS